MTDHELSQSLSARRALVVHFSHHVLMTHDRPYYPEDMHRVIKRNGEFAVSCCVLWPGHNMICPGSVGVIFKPSAASVLSVCSSDSGSMTMLDGSEGSAGAPLNLLSFEETFRVATGGYNEWRVQGAEIYGIFVDNLKSIMVKSEREIPIMDQVVKCSVQVEIALSDVFSAFPDQRIFTLGSNGLKEIPRPHP